ncbi:transcriptional regulator [Candidatus Poribacteria bacterium]|nr:putative DNA binding domain-containing protein [Candidatus Poribacteria bacterium]MXY28706.1 transcriptional regulator [Candidatus Poribacteria bacterium]MYK17573.1 transcriptional regulator [Candidatus Poribacteria bacterium]
MFNSLTELIEKIHLGEDATIEFKRELPRRSNLADEIAAFANARGGVILIGVDDTGEIVGLNRQELDNAEKTVVEICQDSIDPILLIFTEKLRIDGKNLLKIEVPRSLFVHKTSNGYFIRQGSSKREMPTEQLARLFQTRSQARIIAFDEQFVPNTDENTLKSDLYQRFITEGATEDEVEDLLLKRRLLVKEDGQNRASVAGVLMCHENPDDYLYNSFIQAVFYLSKEMDANHQLDAQDFKGPLDQQIIHAMRFVKRYNAVAARKDVGRIDYPEYSMRAIFEAIVNAVVHRDYSKTGSKIRLFMFDDRLELYSPGALANTVTVDNLRYSQATRNELLARLLSEITLDDDMRRQVARRHFLERRGEGVGIILNESETLSGKTPVYEVFDEELRLTIFAAKSPHEVEKQ